MTENKLYIIGFVVGLCLHFGIKGIVSLICGLVDKHRRNSRAKRKE